MMVRKCWAVFGTFQMKWGRSMSITRTPRGKREAGVSTSFRFRICSSIKPTHFLVHLHFSLDADGRVEQKNRLLASFSYFFQWNCLAFNHVAQCTGVSCSQSTFIYVFTFLKDYLNLCKSFVPLFCFVFFFFKTPVDCFISSPHFTAGNSAPFRIPAVPIDNRYSSISPPALFLFKISRTKLTLGN